MLMLLTIMGPLRDWRLTKPVRSLVRGRAVSSGGRGSRRAARPKTPESLPAVEGARRGQVFGSAGASPSRTPTRLENGPAGSPPSTLRHEPPAAPEVPARHRAVRPPRLGQ